MADVASGSVLLTPKFDNLTSSIADQLDGAFSGASKIGGKAGSDAGGKFSSGLSAKAGAVMGLVSSVTSNAFDAISNSLGSAIGRVDTMNNFPKVMKNLGYSSDDASASIKKMSASIDGLPTSLPALTGMVQQLAPLCGGLDEATNIGIAFNDMCLASGASTADVSRAMQQYSQILSKGIPDMQDWKTLQEVMPGQLNQVAKALIGPTANSKDLYNALKDGSITMGDFNNAVMKLDTDGVDGFASFAQQAKDSTQGIGTAIENVQNRVAKAIQVVIEAIGAENISGAINAFSSTFSGIGTAIATVIGLVKDAVTAIGSAIKSVIPEDVLDGISSAFSTMAPAVMTAVVAFAEMIPVVKGLSAAFSVIKGIKTIGTVLTAVCGGPVGLAIAAIAAIVAALAYLYNTNEDVRNAIAAVGQWVSGMAAKAVELGTAFVQFFSELPGKIAAFLASAIAATSQWATDTAAKAVEAGSQFVSNVCTFLSELPGNVANFLSQAISNIVGFVSDLGTKATEAGTGFLDGISSGFKSAVQFVQEIPGKIVGFFSDCGSWLINSGKALLDGFKSGIEEGFNSAKNAVSGGLDTLRGFFPFSPAKYGPFSGHGYTTYSGKALMGDFGKSIVGAASSTAAMAERAMGTVHDALVAQPVDFSASSRGVSGIKSAAARVAMDVSASRDESAAAVIGWLGNNLPAIISECTPVMGESDFGRKVRKAVAYA